MPCARVLVGMRVLHEKFGDVLVIALRRMIKRRPVDVVLHLLEAGLQWMEHDDVRREVVSLVDLIEKIGRVLVLELFTAPDVISSADFAADAAS